MLVMLAFITVGFLLKKLSILPDGAQSTLSRLEIYVFLPAMCFHNMLTKCTPQALEKNWPLTVGGLCLVLVALPLAYVLSRAFVPGRRLGEMDAYERNIYTYALTFGNFGFMGNYIALGIWGQEGLFDYSTFTITLTMLCNSWGLMVLTPKTQGVSSAAAIIKRVFSPAVIALLVGALCGLGNVGQHLPSFVTTAFSNASSCMGPVAMILAGIVIGSFNFKELLSMKKVYVVTVLRLLVIPAAMLLLLKGLRVDDRLLPLTLVAFATPLGLNTVVFPAAYGGNVKLGAGMTLVSHLLSVVTIPLMYYLFIVF